MSEKLALHGGPKAFAVAPGRGHFGNEEKQAVCDLFADAVRLDCPPGYNGPQEELFCSEFADLIGTKFADGVNSGTNALFVALKALDLPPFSEVVVSSVTDPGGIMPVVINSCIPVPADTCSGSFNIGAREIESRINQRTSAIVVSHIGGEPADMESIMRLASKHDLPVIEDCAQSHLGRINGKNVGTFGRFGVFSLMSGKHMCSGGQGGMVVCGSEEDYWRLRRAADRGKPFGLPAGATNVIPSLNCNMDEIHAAIGRSQIKKLPGIVRRRQQVIGLLKQKGFSELESVSIPEINKNFEHCYWWWRVKFNGAAMKCTKEEFCEALQAEGLSILTNYFAAIPTEMDWFKHRKLAHPWNNPNYTGDPDATYPIPNCKRSIKDHYILYVFESYGEKEADSILRAYKKVEAFFAK